MRRACVAVTARRGKDSARVAVSLDKGHVLVAGVASDASVQHIAGEADALVLSLALSADGTLVAIGAEDKKVRVVELAAAADNANDGAAAAKVLGHREVAKKPTALLFADAAGKDVLLASDKFGDVWACPLPDISAGVQHLLGHTGTCVTSMAMTSHEGADYLLTGDRAEHVRVSRFPKTPLIQGFLTGHSDYITAVAAGPAPGTVLTAAADGTVGVWDVLTGACHCTVDVEALLQPHSNGSATEPGAAAFATDASSTVVTDDAAAAAGSDAASSGSASRKRPLEAVLAADTAEAAEAAGTAAEELQEDEQEGDEEGDAPNREPSRTVYPIALAVLQRSADSSSSGSGMVAVALGGLSGAVAVLRITAVASTAGAAVSTADGKDSSSSSSSSSSGAYECTLAHRLQLHSGNGEVHGLVCSGSSLFVFAEGEQPVQAFTATEGSVVAAEQGSAGYASAAALCDAMSSLQLSLPGRTPMFVNDPKAAAAKRMDSQDAEGVRGLRKRLVNSKPFDPNSRSRSKGITPNAAAAAAATAASSAPVEAAAAAETDNTDSVA